MLFRAILVMLGTIQKIPSPGVRTLGTKNPWSRANPPAFPLTRTWWMRVSFPPVGLTYWENDDPTQAATARSFSQA